MSWLGQGAWTPLRIASSAWPLPVLQFFLFITWEQTFLIKEDIAGALDVIPTIRGTLLACTLGSILINGVTIFKKK